MNIKEKIGQRIKEERQAKGFTLKNLMELTNDLKQSRISNWERGDRTPGPEEIKLLAQALEVSPAYLMCFTDEKQPKKIPGLGALIPVLNHQQACDAKTFIDAIRDNQNVDEVDFMPISAELSSRVGEYAFALRMKDDSMHPELRVNDILIIEPTSQASPGSLIVASLHDSEEVIIRRYKQLSISKGFTSFELRAENEHWGSIKIEQMTEEKILGIIISICRTF